MNLRRHSLLVIVLLAAGIAGAADLPDKYMPLSEVKPGMKGIGRSVFKGDKIETFEIEVVGVLKNFRGPGRHLVLVACTGQGLEETGVIAGMSGSPVYINGKMMGAVGYSLTQFSVGKVLAGVTPIEDMLKVGSDAAALGSGRPAAGLEPPTLEEVIEARTVRERGETPEKILSRTRPTAAAIPASGGERFEPIAVPLAISGAPAAMVDVLGPFLREVGLVPMQSAGAVGKDDEEVTLEPGGVIGVQLLRGDMDFTGIGTVTEVTPDGVYGFGHPMFGFGDVDFPMTGGIVQTVVGNRIMSFKLGEPRGRAGRLVRDSGAAIFGHAGEDARMIPITLALDREGRAETFNFEAIDSPLFTPRLAAMTIIYGLFAADELPLEQTTEYAVTLSTEKYGDIEVENVISGDSMWAPYAVLDEVGMPLSYIMNNPFEEVRVTGISSRITVRPKRTDAIIERVIVGSIEATPGEEVPLTVRIRPYRKDPVDIETSFIVPEDAPDGPLPILVCSADYSLMMDMNERPYLRDPQNFGHVMRVLRMHERRDRICVRVPRPGMAVAMEGEAMAPLPASVVGVMSSAPWVVARLAPRTTKKTISTEWTIEGAAQTMIRVRRPLDAR